MWWSEHCLPIKLPAACGAFAHVEAQRSALSASHERIIIYSFAASKTRYSFGLSAMSELERISLPAYARFSLTITEIPASSQAEADVCAT